ncbi:hypothetical protein ELS24_11580 [Achromobacter spanius]|uniref:toxin VasX n=1 Tax=Achromobacter spanius TaxID=217203 RepID=UPI000F8FB217|nr:toxin VasX [Achromobacter spanius]AZS79034.1 hypothetical protein ELS24_11580 [Achromobacter spanius]
MTTPTLESLVPQILRIADRTRCDAGPSAVVACKSEVAILPLRYAVLTDADPALEALAPALPPHLASGLPPLQGEHARYAVRTMRRGYLYLFTKRFRNDWSCESAYRTYDSGLLKRVFPYAPSASNTSRSMNGQPACTTCTARPRAARVAGPFA